MEDGAVYKYVNRTYLEDIFYRPVSQLFITRLVLDV